MSRMAPTPDPARGSRSSRARWRGRCTIGWLLVCLAALGAVTAGWEWTRRTKHESEPPAALVRTKDGLAISLNGLERGGYPSERLPGLDLRGVILDRAKKDWVIFGREAPERPGLPVDTVTISLRAIRLHLEAPGIDIQPRRGGKGRRPGLQEVRYFGGVGGSVVGSWFFDFDYWMKVTSLSEGPAPFPGLPIYWQRALEALDQEITAQATTGRTARVRHNRFWLCAGEFEAAAEADTLTFTRTPLRVLAESMPASGERTGAPASPCSSRGTDDPLAADFATSLTGHLGELGHLVPIREIHDFSRLLAGLTWLAERDPYRDLRPWLTAPVAAVETRTAVPTLARRAFREQTIPKGRSLVVHRYRIEVSGGVLVLPRLAQVSNGDEALRHLRQAVLAERPATDPVTWRFAWWPPAR